MRRFNKASEWSLVSFLREVQDFYVIYIVEESVTYFPKMRCSKFSLVSRYSKILSISDESLIQTFFNKGRFFINSIRAAFLTDVILFSFLCYLNCLNSDLRAILL